MIDITEMKDVCGNWGICSWGTNVPCDKECPGYYNVNEKPWILEYRLKGENYYKSYANESEAIGQANRVELQKPEYCRLKHIDKLIPKHKWLKQIL